MSDEDMREIAVGAIKYSYLSQDRERDVIFTWDKALNFEGNSGPYIQYAYVRAKKIISEVAVHRPEKGSPAPVLSRYDISLIQMLYSFHEHLEEAVKKYKPHILAGYAYALAVAFNSFYVHTPKIREETDATIQAFRISLVRKTTDTLEQVFSLLGIKMPSEM